MLLILLILLGAPVPLSQGATASRCADCHFANPTAPGQDHLYEWELSPHGRHDVGCERCHGGDPTQFEVVAAHRALLSPNNPASPVARRQLPATCGKCHIGPFVAFQQSRHFELLTAGDRRTPICSTCHGDVGAHLLSPLRLEKKCLACHEEAGDRRAQEPAQARRLLERIETLRATLKSARLLLSHVEPAGRRAQLQDQLEQVEVPLTEAIDLGHSFKFSQATERLEVAERRGEELMGKLANPG